MANHKFKPIVARSRDTLEPYGGRCTTCGWTSPWCANRQGPEDEFLKHLKYIERVRAGLASRTPSLASQRDHYRAMEGDPDTPEKDRVLWKQLADELDKRLGATVQTVDEPLPLD